MTQTGFPYRIDARGRTAGAAEDAHIAELIEQLLFTSPGERVHRPELGTALRQLVFAPNSDELAAATEALVQGALQRWLGDRVQIEAVAVRAEDATLTVTVQYVVRRDQQRRVSEFRREA